MAEAIQMAKAESQQQSLVVVVEGKVSAWRVQDQKYYTTIVCPAADAYSQPSVVEVRSKHQIGNQDQIVTVRAKLGGFMGKPFQVVDKNTGAQRQARNVILTLDIIE